VLTAVFQISSLLPAVALVSLSGLQQPARAAQGRSCGSVDRLTVALHFAGASRKVLQSLDDVQAEVQMSVRGERRSTNSLRPSAKRVGLRLADVLLGYFVVHSCWFHSSVTKNERLFA
jgi:hypothetical protein